MQNHTEIIFLGTDFKIAKLLSTCSNAVLLTFSMLLLKLKKKFF